MTSETRSIDRCMSTRWRKKSRSTQRWDCRYSGFSITTTRTAITAAATIGDCAASQFERRMSIDAMAPA